MGLGISILQSQSFCCSFNILMMATTSKCWKKLEESPGFVGYIQDIQKRIEEEVERELHC